MLELTQYDVWAVDFEFGASPGERPEIRCMVAKNYHTGETIRLWEDELSKLKSAPFLRRKETVMVAYYASAELGCFKALGWEYPPYVLDLFTEFRNQTNGVGGGNSLLHALQYFGIPSIEAREKDDMRALALRGGTYTDQERQNLLDYCESDVLALEQLLPRMMGGQSLVHALHRGEYMKAVAGMEHHGIPIDMAVLERLRARWDSIKQQLVAEMDAAYGVYDGTTFKQDRFAAYLTREGIAWPQLPTGSLQLDDDTFKTMARRFPQLELLRQLRNTLAELRLNDLAVGADGRNRTLLSPYRSRTGRNQPGNSRFIFGAASWLRALIKPEEGRAIAYIDYSQQEFGIAAALSGDVTMQAAFHSGDPYLAFAKQAKLVPEDATKASHKTERDLCKQCILGVQYGMGERALASAIGRTELEARELLEMHRRTYPTFWQWSDAAVNFAQLYGYLHTAMGWRLNTSLDSNPRMLRNFPMQANGAEILRRACIAATNAGISLCAPIHDALLIEAPVESIEAIVAQMQQIMAQAGADVLGGFPLRSDAKIYRYPERFVPERGVDMWNRVMGLIEMPESRV